MRGTRKLMAVAASCVLAVSLAACGGGDEEPAAEDVAPSEAPSDALDVEIDEAIEVIAHGDVNSSKVVGKAVRDIGLPQGTSLGAILRGEDVVIAHGETIIESEDHVILFVVDKGRIREVEQLFQVDVTFI